MLRMYVAEECFGLSEDGIEEAIYDSRSIRTFVGIDLGRESVLDATTLLKFRHLLEADGLTRQIFKTINGHLAEKGLICTVITCHHDHRTIAQVGVLKRNLAIPVLAL